MESYNFHPDDFNLINFGEYQFGTKIAIFTQQIIDVFRTNNCCFLSKPTIINLAINPFSPVTHCDVSTILTSAFTLDQYLYQLSHEFTHYYLNKAVCKKLQFVEELLASAMSLYIGAYFPNYKISYLSNCLKTYKLLTKKEEFKNFINEFSNELPDNPYIIYNKNILPAYCLKDLNIFDIIKDIKYLSNISEINDLNTLLTCLSQQCKFSSSKKFINFFED